MIKSGVPIPIAKHMTVGCRMPSVGKKMSIKFQQTKAITGVPKATCHGLIMCFLSGLPVERLFPS